LKQANKKNPTVFLAVLNTLCSVAFLGLDLKAYLSVRLKKVVPGHLTEEPPVTVPGG